MRSKESLIVVTGATGWVGRNMLHILQKKISHKKFNSNVIALANKENIIQSTGYSKENIIEIKVENLRVFPQLCKDTNKIFLIHSAFLTRNYIKNMNLNEYIYTNKYITKTICDGLMLCKDHKVVEISSGAASAFDNSYQKSNNKNLLIKDPYAYLKKAEEVEISKYGNSLILRIYALSGAYVRNPLIYALGSFLLKAIKGESFRIDAIRPVYRSYGHAQNISELACSWMLSNDSSINRIINTVSHTTDLISLAKLITDHFHLPEAKHKIDFNKNPDSYISSEDEFLNLLKIYDIKTKSFKEQVLDTANYLKSRL
tara:strand:+ start:1839 stop:2783 length:945 start_codon:yes stop_codon:yes gene_type:complete